ncbi:hypothetical protein H6F76_07020 [Leptolyngbya sp. FACHB-321]|uniref:hypothetical protein n=1 Tax=Leptolyngbya sp. FACHB-321 TaxID=2692807 RepID=UPI001682B738|nr:hypothetical protein [Leptolyngbya sp. FACHB-321]MBD2034785.1 hypothetical protein [Leptolyngbya sp. FACHB-321]
MSTAFRSAPQTRRPPSTRRSPLYPMTAKQNLGKKSVGKPSLQQRSLHSAPPASRSPLRAVSAPESGMSAVKRFPATETMPLWLRLLIQAQRSSVVVAFVLVTATLFVYSSTVYTQQLWSKEYRKLKTLTRNEREMIATNESLKNQLALQAGQPGSGLVPQTPDSTIFLQPALQRSASSPSTNLPQAEAVPKTPLGY